MILSRNRIYKSINSNVYNNNIHLGANTNNFDSNYNYNDNDGIQYTGNTKIDDLQCNNNGNYGIHRMHSYKN